MQGQTPTDPMLINRETWYRGPMGTPVEGLREYYRGITMLVKCRQVEGQLCYLDIIGSVLEAAGHGHDELGMLALPSALADVRGDRGREIEWPLSAMVDEGHVDAQATKDAIDANESMKITEPERESRIAVALASIGIHVVFVGRYASWDWRAKL